MNLIFLYRYFARKTLKRLFDVNDRNEEEIIWN